MSAVILPSILTNNKDTLLTNIRSWPDWLTEAQLDLADGKFVTNALLEPKDLVDIETRVAFEAHLMVEEPAQWVEQLADISWIKTVLIHAESHDFARALSLAKEQGKKVGLAIRPETGVAVVQPYTDQIDLVLVMTVEPGFMGSPFLPEMLEKVRMLRQIYSDLSIEVDGGIGPETIKSAAEAGADRFVIGSFFQQVDVNSGMEVLRYSLGGSDIVEVNGKDEPHERLILE